MRVSFLKSIKIECMNEKMGGGGQNKIGAIKL
jgi:hypothetical protein